MWIILGDCETYKYSQKESLTNSELHGHYHNQSAYQKHAIETKLNPAEQNLSCAEVMKKLMQEQTHDASAQLL